MDNSKGTSSNLLQDVIMVIDALLGLDVHRLRNILGIDVENELVIVLDLALLASDLLASVRINWRKKDACRQLIQRVSALTHYQKIAIYNFIS